MLALAFGECHGPDILRTYATDLAAAVGEMAWQPQTNGKHKAFRARFEFCNFQPQQFLGP